MKLTSRQACWSVWAADRRRARTASDRISHRTQTNFYAAVIHGVCAMSETKHTEENNAKNRQNLEAVQCFSREKNKFKSNLNRFLNNKILK